MKFPIYPDLEFPIIRRDSPNISPSRSFFFKKSILGFFFLGGGGGGCFGWVVVGGFFWLGLLGGLGSGGGLGCFGGVGSDGPCLEDFREELRLWCHFSFVLKI